VRTPDVLGVGRRRDLGREHVHLHLEEQRVQLLVARPIDQRLGWQGARCGRPKARGLRQIQRHLLAVPSPADTQKTVPVTA
jgi:hypothetical protein